MIPSPQTRTDRRRPQVSLHGAVATWFGDMFRIYRDTFEAQRRFTVTVLQASAAWSPLALLRAEEKVHNAHNSEGARSSARGAAGTSPRIVEQGPARSGTATGQASSDNVTQHDGDDIVREHGVSVLDADADDQADAEDGGHGSEGETVVEVDDTEVDDTEDEVDAEDRDQGSEGETVAEVDDTEDEVDAEDSDRGSEGETVAEVDIPEVEVDAEDSDRGSEGETVAEVDITEAEVAADSDRGSEGETVAEVDIIEAEVAADSDRGSEGETVAEVDDTEVEVDAEDSDRGSEGGTVAEVDDTEDQVDARDDADTPTAPAAVTNGRSGRKRTTEGAEADVIAPHASERGGRAGRSSGTKVRRAGTKSSSGPRAPRPAKRA